MTRETLYTTWYASALAWAEIHTWLKKANGDRCKPGCPWCAR